VLWVLVDVLLVVAALAVLAVLVLGLWRKVRDLGREVGRAGEAIGRATDQLAELQAERPELFPDDRRVG
jgi:Sec-independent protein translocase protein TatA